jgi:hypothetical protein
MTQVIFLPQYETYHQKELVHMFGKQITAIAFNPAYMPRQNWTLMVCNPTGSEIKCMLVYHFDDHSDRSPRKELYEALAELSCISVLYDIPQLMFNEFNLLRTNIAISYLHFALVENFETNATRLFISPREKGGESLILKAKFEYLMNEKIPLRTVPISPEIDISITARQSVLREPAVIIERPHGDPNIIVGTADRSRAFRGVDIIFNSLIAMKESQTSETPKMWENGNVDFHQIFIPELKTYQQIAGRIDNVKDVSEHFRNSILTLARQLVIFHSNEAAHEMADPHAQDCYALVADSKQMRTRTPLSTIYTDNEHVKRCPMLALKGPVRQTTNLDSMCEISQLYGSRDKMPKTLVFATDIDHLLSILLISTRNGATIHNKDHLAMFTHMLLCVSERINGEPPMTMIVMAHHIDTINRRWLPYINNEPIVSCHVMTAIARMIYVRRPPGWKLSDATMQEVFGGLKINMRVRTSPHAEGERYILTPSCPKDVLKVVSLELFTMLRMAATPHDQAVTFFTPLMLSFLYVQAWYATVHGLTTEL